MKMVWYASCWQTAMVMFIIRTLLRIVLGINSKRHFQLFRSLEFKVLETDTCVNKIVNYPDS